MCRPVPLDAEYTRDLGYGAARFVRRPGGSIWGRDQFCGRPHVAVAFRSDAESGNRANATRKVDISGEGPASACRYMIRLKTRTGDPNAWLK